MIYVTGDMHGDPMRLGDPALRRLKKGDTLLIYPMYPFTVDGKEYSMESPLRITDATKASTIRENFTPSLLINNVHQAPFLYTAIHCLILILLASSSEAQSLPGPR